MMNTKTCPHCNEVALYTAKLLFIMFNWDDEDYRDLIEWRCTDCGKRFYTEAEDESI